MAINCTILKGYWIKDLKIYLSSTIHSLDEQLWATLWYCMGFYLILHSHLKLGGKKLKLLTAFYVQELVLGTYVGSFKPHNISNW